MGDVVQHTAWTDHIARKGVDHVQIRRNQVGTWDVLVYEPSKLLPGGAPELAIRPIWVFIDLQDARERAEMVSVVENLPILDQSVLLGYSE